jgi:hypothetical protein
MPLFGKGININALDDDFNQILILWFNVGRGIFEVNAGGFRKTN